MTDLWPGQEPVCNNCVFKKIGDTNPTVCTNALSPFYQKELDLFIGTCGFHVDGSRAEKEIKDVCHPTKVGRYDTRIQNNSG